MSSSRIEISFSEAPSISPVIMDIDPIGIPIPLTTLLAERHQALNMRCGGQGLCTGCRMNLLSGSLQHIATGQVIEASEGKDISACQYSPCPGLNAVITIPITSRTGHSAQIADEFKTRVLVARAPLFSPLGIAAAVDIGTTTVAVLLADVDTGHILARATALNRQSNMGDNVVTRINHCMMDKGNVAKLQQLILAGTVVPLLKRACAEAKLSPSSLSGIVFSGNTIMLHLAAGIDPSSMGVAPFTPVFLDHRCMTSSDLGLEGVFPASMPIHLLPSLASYVGADINSGIVATGMHYENGPSLLVDIGTNGEIVLKCRDRLLGCATAAGPAFEGAGLSCGIQAIEGAISKITFTNDPFSIHLERIHDRAGIPCPGICGSAYIDFLGEGLRQGILNTSGRFTKEFTAAHPETIQTIDEDRVFILQSKKNAQGQIVGISERDISLILQAKAAIAAGILTLLARSDLQPADICKLYLAGGFGLHLNVVNAIACGLLPGFTPEQVEVVGNTSLAGAYITLQDRGILDELLQNQGRVEVVELNLDAAFEDRYIENLQLEVD